MFGSLRALLLPTSGSGGCSTCCPLKVDIGAPLRSSEFVIHLLPLLHFLYLRQRSEVCRADVPHEQDNWILRPSEPWLEGRWRGHGSLSSASLACRLAVPAA